PKGNTMNRTIRYTAGLMIAAGVSVAIAGPATAAPDRPRNDNAGFSSFQSPFNQFRNNPVRTNPVRNNPVAGYYGGNVINTAVVTNVNVVGNGLTQQGAFQAANFQNIGNSGTTITQFGITGR
ncbi:MAG TPA: hypothetical protein VN408_17525, partial [Actinoplanes sp.]|nr:hypothetical protein [Actinoplanes sp.]